MWNNCKYPDCENWARRSDGDFCSHHERLERKESENTKREAEKRAKMIEKAKKKNQEPRKLPNKVSPKREELNKEYFKLVEQFKKDNPNCNARINNYCTGKTDDPHHSRGRGVYLLDVSTWIPVCRSCHNYIEQHPSDAMKRGLSFSRLAKDISPYDPESYQKTL